MSTDWFAGFEATHLAGADPGVQVFTRWGGARDKPALVLLHGFPQSHVLWHRVARQLAHEYFLVLPDLRGYGDSSKPPGEPDHANYSKRRMASDLVAVADQLGVDRFFLCGHDRGGRVAHRLALDHRQRVRRLALIDIAPTLDMYAGLWGKPPPPSPAGGDPYFNLARAYYHWFHLIQPAPLPERMILGDAPAYLRTKLGGWGGSGTGFIEPQALAEYERCFCNPTAVHAACEDYRASAGIDLEHDQDSRARGERIACDTLVVWGERGVIQRLFDPQALWQAQCAGRVQGLALPAGHFLPEELPAETAQALRGFFTP